MPLLGSIASAYKPQHIGASYRYVGSRLASRLASRHASSFFKDCCEGTEPRGTIKSKRSAIAENESEILITA